MKYCEDMLSYNACHTLAIGKTLVTTTLAGGYRLSAGEKSASLLSREQHLGAICAGFGSLTCLRLTYVSSVLRSLLRPVAHWMLIVKNVSEHFPSTGLLSGL